MTEKASAPSQKGRIFVSYRRTDSAGYAGRIYDRLVAYFGEDATLMDVDMIEGGTDFVKVLEDAVQSCDLLIALIGRQWLSIKDKSGKRRLDDPEDFVRVEIAAALKRNIRVIPVLVDGVEMPQPSELPENLKNLARRNALQVNHHSFNPDVYRLIEHSKSALDEAEKSRVMKSQALQAAREKEEHEATEKAKRERAEKAEREKLEWEIAKNAERESREREIAEKVANDKAQKEQAEREAEKRRNDEIKKRRLPFSEPSSSIYEEPKREKPEPEKTVGRRKPNTAIIVAVIGLIGTICAALISFPYIVNFLSPPSSATPNPTSTLHLTQSSGITAQITQSPSLQVAVPNLSFIIDTSGSMRDRRIEGVQAAVSSFISNLSSDHLISLITFDDQVRVEHNFGSDHSSIIETIQSLSLGDSGGTCLFDALFTGIEQMATTTEEGILIIFSDGFDSISSGGFCSQHTFGDVISLSDDYPVVIYAVGIGDGADDINLNQISMETGGNYYESVDENDLSSILISISEDAELEINSQSVISTPNGSIPLTSPTSPTTYTLQKDEFTYCIARRFNINPMDLLQASDLSSPDIYYAGLVLTIPQNSTWPVQDLGQRAIRNHPDTYTVTGDADTSVYGVACKFGDVFPEDIAALNGISLGSTLTVSQVLNIP